LVFQHSRQVDCGRVTADADCVKRARRRSGDDNHEAQRGKSRKAPDQTQCQYSAFDREPDRSLADN
jgi:hypothetical protein